MIHNVFIKGFYKCSSIFTIHRSFATATGWCIISGEQRMWNESVCEKTRVLGPMERK